jgi:hypothetical protein
VTTAVVVTVNVAVDAPCNTTTLAGTVAEALLLERLTVNPPTPAGSVRVTVPVAGTPPRVDVGLTATDASAA